MRTVVITGAASGIGKALAERLTAAGDKVIGVDIRDADVTVDLTTAEGRTTMVAKVRELSGGSIDAVVANAGLATATPATVGVNYFGALATLEGLRPLLAGSDAPRAVATCSMASLQPTDAELVDAMLAGDEELALKRAEMLVGTDSEGAIYASTKAALARWIRRNAASPDWAGAHIPLNAIAPGVVETPMVAPLMQTDEARKYLEDVVPMPLNGFMPAAAPAALLAWLISPENTHLCGQVVFIDGDSTW
jgi:NAD(P)-dependent dehydrogenase (short-subunit alcohol dehydrogenase family)